jgi:hypothetical protein
MEIENQNDQLDEQTEATESVEETQAEETNAEAESSESESSSSGEESEEGKAEENSEEGGKEGEGDESGAEDKSAAAFKPNTKVKVGHYDPQTRQFTQKEVDIDPKFHSLMKDPEGEKLIRELHEKAHGLDAVKERFKEEKQISTTYQNHYGTLKNIYKSAIKPGNELNILKMDKWLKEIDVPQEVMLRWAMAKVNLHKLQQENPEQYNTLQGQLTAEEQAELQQQNALQTQQSNQDMVRQNKELQIELVLKNPDMLPFANHYESLTGKPGSFREALILA